MAKKSRVDENVRATIAELDKRISDIRSAIIDNSINKRAMWCTFTTYELILLRDYNRPNYFGDLDETREAVIAISRDGDKTRKLIDDFARASNQRRIYILQNQLAPDWAYEHEPKE